MSTAIHTALLAAPIAVLYAVVLAGEDTPLNRWFRWLERMADHKGWRSWIAKPLGACERCFGGQLALWISVAGDGHGPVEHLSAAGWCVLFATALAAAYRWLMRRI